MGLLDAEGYKFLEESDSNSGGVDEADDGLDDGIAANDEDEGDEDD